MSEGANLNFDWSITKFKGKLLVIKLKFERPSNVSREREEELLMISFNDPYLWKNTKGVGLDSATRL